jgi:hypothetical protein
MSVPESAGVPGDESAATVARQLAHLNLRAWPFAVVPSPDHAPVWVGRKDAERKLKVLLRTAMRVQSSRIVLLWAPYGQGKTHALHYLRAMSESVPSVKALYVVTPQGIKDFVDVYRAIIESALGDGVLDDLGLALFQRHGPQAPTDLQRALIRLVTFEEPQTRAALSWLRAEKVGLRDIKDVGLSRRIETSADGIELLNELISLLRTELDLRVLLLLDEIQELGGLAPRRLDEAVGGLHKVFDRNTDGLTLLFCFTTAQQGTIKRIIGETLYERRSEVLTLPALDEPAAAEFVAGLVAAWSVDDARVPFPFTADAIGEVVERLAADIDELTPRDLIRAFDAVLRAADLDIEDGEIEVIDGAYALAHLPELGEA